MHADIAEFKPNDNISDVYLLWTCQLRTTKNGKYYLHLELGDRTGRINARMWNATEALFEALSGARFARVGGRVEVYQDALQVIVNNIRSVRADEIDPAEFLPATRRDVDEMFAKLRTLGESVKNEHLARLLDDVFADETFTAKLRKAPAAVSYHQPFLGGLLEHTLDVTELADLIAPRYPGLDRDLLITGCILHDMGKVDELSYETAFEYTDRGRLIGHLILAV
ncbi:MAG TPA: HD domain-containing protein, partial [Planctomycetota bacterium]|nr:HD domain-containing protein [Planctomycetota bacterium]